MEQNLVTLHVYLTEYRFHFQCERYEMLSKLIESEANAIPKSNGILCLITDGAHPPVLCAYSQRNNRKPTQLENWKAPKYALSLSTNSKDRINNECFFSVWLFHIIWLVMLILSEGTIEAVECSLIIHQFLLWNSCTSIYERWLQNKESDNYNRLYLFWLRYERRADRAGGSYK